MKAIKDATLKQGWTVDEGDAEASRTHKHTGETLTCARQPQRRCKFQPRVERTPRCFVRSTARMMHTPWWMVGFASHVRGVRLQESRTESH